MVPEIIPEIIEPVKTEKTPNTIIDKKTVENAWTAFMAKLETTGPSLVFLLKMAEVKEIINNSIIISVRYSFHYDKLSELATKKKLEDQLSELLKTKILLKFEVNENASTEKTAALNDLAAAFGGEVM